MRTFSKKDIEAIAKAFQLFICNLSGEKLEETASKDLIQNALSNGIRLDTLFNKNNYFKVAQTTNTPPTANDYIEAIENNYIMAIDVKEEENWFVLDPDFMILAEVYHRFYSAATGKEGRWNNQQFARVFFDIVNKTSLQSIMNTSLIDNNGEEPPFAISFLLNLLDNDFTEDEPLTQEQQNKIDQDIATQEALNNKEEPEDFKEEETTTESEGTDPINALQMEEDNFYETFETNIMSGLVPRNFKRSQITATLFILSPGDINILSACVPGATTLETLIDKLTDNKLDTSLENIDAQQIHSQINAELIPKFIDYVQGEGIDIDEEAANNMDVLCSDWDLRNPNIRKFEKLKMLIFTHAIDDEDLVSTIPELEKLFLSEN